MRYGLILALLLASTSHGVADELPRGIVDKQPAEGPYVKVDAGYMVPYSEQLVGTDIKIEMIPVPGGVFTFGSPVNEEGRGEIELEAVKVKLPAFWVAKHELTWGAYWEYMKLNDVFAEMEAVRTALASENADEATAAKDALATCPTLAQALGAKVAMVDGVTAPTPLYDPSTTYEHGEEPTLPATTMTPFGAKQFTKWLSRTSGVDYRLPTEAEWEYAARAGETKNSVDSLDDVAWYDDNSDWVTNEGGKKKPNAFGLYDMLGNVAEWVIDEYDDDLQRPDKPVLEWNEAVRWANSDHSRVCRGGFYESTAEDCRFTSRFYSEDVDWKANDPCAPTSPWWYTDYPSMGVGMRIVRSLEPLSPEMKQRFWEPESQNMADDVTGKLASQRAKLGPASTELPKIQEELQTPLLRPIIDGNKLEPQYE